MTKGTGTKGMSAKGKGVQFDGKDIYNVYKPTKQKAVATVKREKEKK